MHDGKIDFDGLFCVTDSLAFEVLHMLGSLGIHAPDDIQVIGFDGINRLGYKGYTCSSILQPAADMAETCVDILLQEKGISKHPLICLPVSFVQGETTHSII